jgi:hypothetical protein
MMNERRFAQHFEVPGPGGTVGLPFGAIWSAFTSEYGEFTSQIISQLSGDSTVPPARPETMTTTAEVTVPVSTITVHPTVLETSFVTVPLTTVDPPSSSSLLSRSIPSRSSQRRTTSTLSSIYSTTSAVAQSSLSTWSATTPSATLPVVVSGTSSEDVPTGSMTLTLQTNQPAATPAAPTALALSGSARLYHKRAVIGGLCGAIAGLLLVGAFIFCCLRRRRRRKEDDASEHYDDGMAEKGLRPALKRKWTELTGRGTPKPTPQLPPASSPLTVDEDHHIIRMNTNHWVRPYAQGTGEGYRESMPPGQLRVMNPDISRPVTPRSDTASSFLRKQRSALAAVLFSNAASRSRASSNAASLRAPVPEILIDPALSRECIAPNVATPSFRSYPSVTSLPLVQQQPPEDPFVTPPEEKGEPTASIRPSRPHLTPIQSATSFAGRTRGHIGSVLNVFRSQSHTAESTRSVSSWESRPSQRGSRYSDPFDLDKASVKESNDVHKGRSTQVSTLGLAQQQPTLYEGT